MKSTQIRTAELHAAQHPRIARTAKFARVAAALTCGMGVAVLAGWALDVAWLREPIPGLYVAEGGVTVMVLGFLVMFTAGIVFGARALNRVDADRRESALTEQRLAAIVQSSSDAIIGKRLDGTIESWNTAAERLYGYSAGEAVGRSIAMLVPPGREDEVPALLERIGRGEQVDAYETVRVRKDGSEVDVSLTISPVRDTAGDVVGAAVVARDVTARKRAEEALRQAHDDLELNVQRRTAELAAVNVDLETQVAERVKAEAALKAEREFLNAVLDNLEDGVVACNAEGQLTLFNRKARELYGVPDRALSPDEWSDYYRVYLADGKTPMDASQVPLFRAFNGEHISGAELVVAKNEDKPLRLVVSGQPILDPEGKRAGAVVALHDVTERDEAREEANELTARLEQSQRLESVGQLAGGIAHDFNNLLAVILNYVAFVLEEMDEGDPMREDVEEIRRAAERAASLTQQLLLFSRREIVKPEVLDLNEVVAGAEKLLQRTIGEHVDLQVHAAANLSPVTADARKLEQVLINLAVNARDAMPEGGRLTIETRNVELDEMRGWSHGQIPAGTYVQLSVGDTGQGMPPDVMERVFEPFFTTKPQGEGTGLGLATVYGIVKQAGGHVELYSEEGLGTSFKVYLPVSGRAEQSSVAGAAAGPAPGRGETVLVAEDQDGVRELTRRILTRNGYVVVEAADGEAALRAYADHGGPIDLLLTDVVMPHLSGRELVEQLGERQPDLNVLYMSGYTEDFVVREEVAERGVGMLEKPFSADALLRGVRETLDRRPTSNGEGG